MWWQARAHHSEARQALSSQQVEPKGPHKHAAQHVSGDQRQPQRLRPGVARLGKRCMERCIRVVLQACHACSVLLARSHLSLGSCFGGHLSQAPGGEERGRQHRQDAQVQSRNCHRGRRAAPRSVLAYLHPCQTIDHSRGARRVKGRGVLPTPASILANDTPLSSSAAKRSGRQAALDPRNSCVTSAAPAAASSTTPLACLATPRLQRRITCAIRNKKTY